MFTDYHSLYEEEAQRRELALEGFLDHVTVRLDAGMSVDVPDAIWAIGGDE